MNFDATFFFVLSIPLSRFSLFDTELTVVVYWSFYYWSFYRIHESHFL